MNKNSREPLVGQGYLNIKPYKPGLEKDILEVERQVMQASLVKMDVLRDSYISRAKVFQSFASYLGYNEKGKLVGAIVGTKVPIKVNGHEFKAGFGLDLLVAPSWQNKGVGTLLSNFLVRNFFHQHNLTKNFITLKASQHPGIKTGATSDNSFNCMDFTCLVIPTKARATGSLAIEKDISFSTDLLEEHGRHPELISCFTGGLCAWHTHKINKLRIRNIHPLARLSTAIMSLLTGKKYPSEGEEIKTAIIFNLNSENIRHINEALEYLDKNGVNYLNVVCRKNDHVYARLKTYSIFDHDHYLVADFPIQPTDNITIDVRCI